MEVRRVVQRVGVRAFFGVLALAFASGVFAQAPDTAYLPFVVNANAVVKAERDGDVISMNVTANTADTLKIPLDVPTSIMQRPQNARNNVPVITNSQRGRVSIDLPGQSYRAAEISLYTISGRRILCTNADASDAAKNISRPNLVAGVYLLTVKGASGQSFSSRLTHSGGNLNINVSFGSENLLTASPAATALSRQAAANAPGGWTITVSAVGYIDSSYTLDVVQGVNEVQIITLISAGNQCNAGSHFNPEVDYGCFTDLRDNKNYRTIAIGTQTWMAENLNWAGPGDSFGVCYDDNPSNCAIYGRLYDWVVVMDLPSSCNFTSCASEVESPHQGICPPGWHVPSDAEWIALVDFVNTNNVPAANNAGTRLKATSGWNSGGNGSDDFGFSALPGGSRWSDGSFGDADYYSSWWSATEYSATDAWRRRVRWDVNHMVRGSWDKTSKYSLRCLEDVRP